MNSNNDENISLEDRINHDLYTYTESRRLNSNLESIVGQESYCESPQLPQEKMKIILVGDHSVGKSSLIYRLKYNDFSIHLKSTNGYEITTIETEFKRKKYLIFLWESPGEEKYEKIIKAFYKDCSALFLMFDLNNSNSFDNLAFWLDQARDFIFSPCTPFLIGNKSDLEKTIKKDLIEDLCRSERIEFLEISTLNGDGLKDFFPFILNKIENSRQSKVFLSTELRNETQAAKREFLFSTELYFAKKNTLLESKMEKKNKKNCFVF